MISQDAFLALVEAFLLETETTATALGREALGDPTFVFELRNGRSCSLAVAGRVDAFMKKRREEKGAAQPVTAAAHAGDKPGGVVAIAEEDLEPDQENDGGCE